VKAPGSRNFQSLTCANGVCGIRTDGWTCGDLTTCGSWGNLCGAIDGNKGRGKSITKSFSGYAPGQWAAQFVYYHIDSWDNEHGVVKVNGKTVWTSPNVRHGDVRKGHRDQCSAGGLRNAWYRTDVSSQAKFTFRVPESGKFTMEITSNLNSDAGDESFGVSDIMIYH